MNTPNALKKIVQILMILLSVAISSFSPLVSATANTNNDPVVVPQVTPEAASKQMNDAFGNVVEDELGARFNFLIQEDGFTRVQVAPDATTIETQTLLSDPFDPSRKADDIDDIIEEPAAPSFPQIEPGYMTEKWRTGIWGTGIGASGIAAFDIDNDGITEIVAGGGYGFGYNRFWYILSYSSETGNYQQEWLSQEYTVTINRIVVSDYNSDQQFEIYVALSNGTIEIYDAITRQLIGSFSSSLGAVGMTVADVDNDNEKEIIVSSSSGIAIYNASTYASEWQTTAYGSTDIAVANVDSDEAPEIVTLNRVIDGVSHVQEWYFSSGFGAILQLADIDGDQIAEIISSKSWYYIYAYDADTHTIKWELTTSIDIQALYVKDIDNDGVQEVVYGDGQWGKIHVYDSITLVQEWNISNPQHGVTDVSFGDVDNDNIVEVIWGGGWSSTGADIFYIGNTISHTIEWQSKDIGGPLSALDVGDVDNDGTNEIVMVSFTSSSGYSDGVIFIYDAQTYALEWQSAPLPYIIAWTGIDNLTLADVDEDGVLEIVIATADTYDGVILAFDGITHDLDWITSEYFGASFSAVAIADIDNDGHLEVIAGQDREHTGATGVYVRVFDGLTGAEEWHTTNLTYWGGVYDIDTGDPDGDGNPEILFSVDDGKAYLYDGLTHNQEWVSSFSYPRAVAFMDVDQDEETEFLVGTGSGTVYAFNGPSLFLEWSQSFSSQSINSLQLADLNKDTAMELVLSDNNYLYIYDAATRVSIWKSVKLGTSVGNRGHLVIQDIDQDTRSEAVLGSSFAMYVFAYDLLPFDASISVDKEFVAPGDTLTYELALTGFAESQLPMVITDVIPANTDYISDSLWATNGSWMLTGNTITWTVELSTSIPVSLTYEVTVPSTVTHGTEIVNLAIFNGGMFIDTRDVSTSVDALPPLTTITQPISGALITGNNYWILGTSIDDDSGLERVEININASGWQTVTDLSSWSFDWSLPIADDFYTFEVRAIDLAGNIETPVTSTVFVDNLSPYIVSTDPPHGATNVLPNSPIILTFSEPISPETFQFICSPNPGDWSIKVNADHTVFTLIHAPFIPYQLYSCMVTQAKDRVMHPLIGGPVPNPWGFIAVPPVVPINNVNLNGPTTGLVNGPLIFTAQVIPISSTLPIVYAWEATEQLPVTVTNGISDTLSFTWIDPGPKVITVTTSNSVSSIYSTHTITVTDVSIAGLDTFNDSPTELGNATTMTATVTAGTNVSYTWDYGDGETGVGAVLHHTYPTIGGYTATVTASNASGVITATTFITVTEVPIVGLLATNNSPTELGNSSTLTATITEGTNVSYTWNFGDGETGVGAVLHHTYPTIGVYTATVTASNSSGVLTVTTLVTITDVPITGLVVIHNGPTELGNTTTFTATITDGTNVSFSWDFGNGENGSGSVLTHTFSAPGVYTVTVTANNSNGTMTATTLIKVTKTNEVYIIYLPIVKQVQLRPEVILLLGNELYIPNRSR